MSELTTPDQIDRELTALSDLADKGSETVRMHELKYAAALDHWQDAYDAGYQSAVGTIAEREIAGRAAAAPLRAALNREKADLNWAKNEVRRIESKQSNLQTRLKAITAAMK